MNAMVKACGNTRFARVHTQLCRTARGFKMGALCTLGFACNVSMLACTSSVVGILDLGHPGVSTMEMLLTDKSKDPLLAVTYLCGGVSWKLFSRSNSESKGPVRSGERDTRRRFSHEGLRSSLV